MEQHEIDKEAMKACAKVVVSGLGTGFAPNLDVMNIISQVVCSAIGAKHQESKVPLFESRKLLSGFSSIESFQMATSIFFLKEFGEHRC